MGRNKRPSDIEGKVFDTIIEDCLAVSSVKGMKLATNIVKKVSILMLSKDHRIIYNALGVLQEKYPEGVPTSAIAKKVKKSAPNVSAQLGYMKRHTSLIEHFGTSKYSRWRQS